MKVIFQNSVIAEFNNSQSELSPETIRNTIAEDSNYAAIAGANYNYDQDSDTLTFVLKEKQLG